MRLKLITLTLFGVLLSIIILGCENSQTSNKVSKINDEIEVYSNSAQSRVIQAGNSNIGTAYQDSGIWVTGTGTIKTEPDIAIITLGVEYSDESLTQARSKTAYSMEQIIKSLKKYSILDRDIQTQSFNIRSNYEYVEIKSGISTRTIQKLIGYTVTNKVIIKIRKLTDIGVIIDDTVLSGGDLTRVDNITFDIEDTTVFQDQARVIAVQNADLHKKLNNFSSEDD